MTTARITHVAERGDWEAAGATGSYVAASLATEGFIHCSTPWQVVRIANARFAGRDDLLLLVIDPAAVGAQVVFENCEGGIEPFPHVYGSLPVAAVESVWPLEWDAGTGSHRFPDGYVGLS